MVEDEKHSKGIKLVKSQEALVGAVVLLACRVKNVGRTMKEILPVCSATKKDLGKAMKVVQKLVHETTGIMAPQSNASDVIQRFCSHLKVSQEVVQAAVHIVEEIQKRGLCQGKVNASIAGDLSHPPSHIVSTVSLQVSAHSVMLRHVRRECMLATRARAVHPNRYTAALS